MKFVQNSLLAALAALAPLMALAPAAAQDLKPVAVVAIASVEETLADIGYLSSVSGMEDAGKTARLFGSALTSGMDKKRPAGMYVIPKDGDFHAVAFIPVTDLKQLLGIHKEYIGEPKDVGDGVLEIGLEQSAFVKEQNGFVPFFVEGWGEPGEMAEMMIEGLGPDDVERLDYVAVKAR